MKTLAARFIFTALLLFGAASAASAAQDEVFLAQMKVVREINLGSTYEYEVESAGRGRAILKTPPFRLKVGEAVNLFVVEGAKENGKPAYMVLKGERARSFKEGFAAVYVGDAWNLIDKNGRLLTQGGFDKVWDFREGFALCKLEKGYAFIGKDGKFLNTPMIYPRIFKNVREYDLPLGFGDGAAIMASRTKNDESVSIVIGKSGEVTGRIDGPVNAKHFAEGLAPVALLVRDNITMDGTDTLYAYMDKNAKIIIPPQFTDAHPFSDGLAAACVKVDGRYSEGKWGFIDKSGKFVIEPKFEQVLSFSEGRAAVRNGGKWGFIDKNGKITVNLSYDGVQPYSEGLAAVRRGGSWGFIDKNGQVVIKFIYENAKPFANGLAPVCVGTQRIWGARVWGYIDKTGKIVIEPKYLSAESFSDGVALVTEGAFSSHDKSRVVYAATKWKYINTKGQAALWFYMREY